MINESFMDIVDALELAEPWSVKVARKSDHHTCMVLDYTGMFLFGPSDGDHKSDFIDNHMKLATHLISADNWYVYAIDCKWKDE